MPAILSDPTEIALWLSDKPWGPEIQRLVRPFEGALEIYQVDQGVGKVQNDSPSFIEVSRAASGRLEWGSAQLTCLYCALVFG
jgi:putative SOS response-associated peptidase YedK